ncbi:MAG: MipA/OmpV family protein [Gallionella sp.]
MKRISHGLLASALLVFGGRVLAETEEFSKHIDGDMGVGAYYTRNIVRGKSDLFSVLPYGTFDYDRMFLRIDTLGIKTAKLGYGYVEISGRFSQDGFHADTANLRGLHNRQTSLPIGLGTMQTTPVGAFFINAFHDVHQSNGNLFEAIYAAEFGTPALMVYPLAGAEYQSAEYVRYYYGISAQEAVGGQYAAYQPGGSFNPLLGVLLDVKLTQKYHLNLYARRKWLGNATQSSPIVGTSTLDSSFISLSYRFE